MSKFHVSQIETHIRALYQAEHWDPELDDVNNLSRLLALYAVHLTLEDAAGSGVLVEVTDGGADRGIDAVGVDPNAKLVVFVQSKWRQDGSGSLALADALKFLRGVRSLLGMKSDGDLPHASEDTRAAVQDLLKTPGARIRLVVVTTASDGISVEVEEPFTELLGQLNDLENTEPMAQFDYLSQGPLFNSIAEASRPSVELELQMLDWGRASDPQKLYYGRVSAVDIAGWHQTHGVDLFADNIRVVIPRSDINDGILETIRNEPQNFAFYNNGITILARKIELGVGGALNRDVGYFRLSGASVVNGAQTVSTLGSVLGTESEANLGSAFVLVRCIEVPEGEEVLGQRVTRFANTQNEVSSQDFAFLDAEQHRLARELGVLDYEYIVRSAEVPRSIDRAKIIDVREAAVALACASPQVGHSVTAKREVSRLFSDPAIYKAIFNSKTDPLRLTRAVLVVREADAVLDALEAKEEGAVAGIAVHARRTLAHIVLREIGDKNLSDPDFDIATELKGLEAKLTEHVEALAAVFPENAYPGNVFKNQARVTSLLAEAGIAG